MYLPDAIFLNTCSKRKVFLNPFLFSLYL